MLRRTPFTRIGRGRLALVLLLPAAIAGVWIAWIHRDALLDWIGGREPVAVIEPLPVPELAVAVDSVALIEACRRALIDYPPWLPAWRIESLACVARLADPELAALRPELAGGPVMLARWRLVPGHAEPLHRQVAEQHLSRWYAASVVDARAWAVVPLAPMLLLSVENCPPVGGDRRPKLTPPMVCSHERALSLDGRGEGEMLVVETIAKIRLDHLVRGVPIKKIARDLRVSKNTVRKVVRGDETSFSYERKIQPMPKLGPWVEELERQLEANEKKAAPGSVVSSADS